MYKILFVGPGTASSDGKMVGRNLLLLGIRKDEPGREMNARVSVYRCNRCFSPHEEAEPHQFFAVGDEQLCVEQVFGAVTAFPFDCRER